MGGKNISIRNCGNQNRSLSQIMMLFLNLTKWFLFSWNFSVVWRVLGTYLTFIRRIYWQKLKMIIVELQREQVAPSCFYSSPEQTNKPNTGSEEGLPWVPEHAVTCFVQRREIFHNDRIMWLRIQRQECHMCVSTHLQPPWVCDVALLWCLCRFPTHFTTNPQSYSNVRIAVSCDNHVNHRVWSVPSSHNLHLK